MVPASAKVAQDFLDARTGPTLITGAMPSIADYGEQASCADLPTQLCGHPVVPPLTEAVLDAAADDWAVALYSQAPAGGGPGSTGDAGGWGPAGLYLVGPEGEAYFVAAGDPAVGPLGGFYEPSLAWAPGRGSVIIARDLFDPYETNGGGFTIVDAISGRTTTIFPTCRAVQADAYDTGWLVRARCPGGNVAAVVDDAGEIVPTNGLLVADRGVAAQIGDDYLVLTSPFNQVPTEYYAIVDGVPTLIHGESCRPTDAGLSVICQDGRELTVATISADGLTIAETDWESAEWQSLKLCSVGDEVVQIEVPTPEDFRVLLSHGAESIVIEPDKSPGPTYGFTCTGTSGGAGYLASAGGVWALDGATGETFPVFEAPSDVFPVSDDWPYEGVPMARVWAAVGGSSFVKLG